MAKTFKILSIDGNRGCMLVRFLDSAVDRVHDTEIAIPPFMPVGSGDAELSEWVAGFWPQAQIEGPTVKDNLALTDAVGRVIDITSLVPSPEDVSPKLRI